MSLTFDENGICILSSITTADECGDYEKFLLDERDRHLQAKHKASYMDQTWRGFPLADFYASAATRHQQDLDGITKRIAEIEAHKATLEVK